MVPVGKFGAVTVAVTTFVPGDDNKMSIIITIITVIFIAVVD